MSRNKIGHWLNSLCLLLLVKRSVMIGVSTYIFLFFICFLSVYFFLLFFYSFSFLSVYCVYDFHNNNNNSDLDRLVKLTHFHLQVRT